jgi:CXXC-20-CXXC protein
MDNCKKCNKKFEFWNVYKSYWKGKSTVKCSDCGTEHDHKIMNKLLLGAVIFIPVIIYTTISFNYQPNNILIAVIIYTLIYILSGFVVSLITTRLFKFKLTETKTTFNKELS